MKKRIFNILLSLCVCLSAASSLASCGDRSSDSESTAATTTTTASSVSDNAVSGEATPAPDSESTSDPAIESSGCAKIVWTSAQDATGDIDIFTAKFKVKDGAASGKTEVTIGGEIIVSDATFQNMDVEVVAGGVNVGGDSEAAATPSGPAIIVETIGANVGDEVEIKVSLVNCEVCTSLDFSLLFDSEVLEFVDITPSDVIDSNGQLLYNVL